MTHNNRLVTAHTMLLYPRVVKWWSINRCSITEARLILIMEVNKQ